MKKYKSKNSLLFCICVLVCFCACKDNRSQEKTSRVDTLPYYQDASFTPHWLSVDDPVLDTFHTIRPFRLINQEGDTITEKTVADKIYIVDFFFATCPGMCPRMMDNMGIIQTEFLNDDELTLISHSVTPNRDSVPILSAYGKARNIRPFKWHLLTGERKQIYRLGREDYFVEEDLGEEKTEDDFLHTENFVLVDKKRHIRGIYNGLKTNEIHQLIADVKTLKKEKI